MPNKHKRERRLAQLDKEAGGVRAASSVSFLESIMQDEKLGSIRAASSPSLVKKIKKISKQ